MRYASVCDGIGAAHCAWTPLGFECAWTSEIDPFAMAVVDHHWKLPNLGDMTKINAKKAIKKHGPTDLFVGGTPCQSFSVAGLRQGLDDPRGNLALVFLGLLDQLRPRWVVWENVPGVLSSSEGRDFGAFLGAMEELGYGWAYRTLDAQFVRVESHPWAVPQRRRRVFVVGYLGDSRRANSVFLERQSMCGYPSSRRVAGETVAGTLNPGAHPGSYNGQDAYSGHLIPQAMNVANCMTQRMYKGISPKVDEGQTPVIVFQPRIGRNGRAALSCGGGATSDSRNCVAFDPTQITHPENRSNPKPGDPSPTLAKRGHPPVLAFTNNGGKTSLGISIEHAPPMGTINSTHGMIARGLSVRRLTPRECERLQGFPDDYTLVEYRNKPATDTPRYQALGNSMAVNVMSWIGQRIKIADGIEA